MQTLSDRGTGCERKRAIAVGVYGSAEDLYKYMSQIFTLAFETDGLAEKLRATGVAIRLNYTDPDSVMAIDFGRGIVECGDEATMEVDVDLEMSADSAHQFWLGKLNVPLAFAKKTIKAKGSISKVLKLAPLMTPMHEKYKDILRDAGLEELIDR